MADTLIIVAICITDRFFGASVYDTVLHNLSIIDANNHATPQKACEMFFKQIAVDVVIHPDNIYKTNKDHRQLLDLAQKTAKKIIAIDARQFDYCLGKQVVVNAMKEGFCTKNNQIKAIVDSNISSDFIHTHTSSIECAGALMRHLEPSFCNGPSTIKIKSMELKSFMAVSRNTLEYLQIFDFQKHPNMHASTAEREGLSILSLLDKTKSIGGREMLRKWLHCPLQTIHEIKERQEAIGLLSLDSASDVVSKIRSILPKVKSIRAVCSRVQIELVFSDLEILSQFCSTVTQIHSLLMSEAPLPHLLEEFLRLDSECFSTLANHIIDTVDFTASRQEERVVVANGISTKVDRLRDQFYNLEELLDLASCKMEAVAGVPVVGVYFPQLGFLSSVDIMAFSDQSLNTRIADWVLKFQTDRQQYYKNNITAGKRIIFWQPTQPKEICGHKAHVKEYLKSLNNILIQTHKALLCILLAGVCVCSSLELDKDPGDIYTQIVDAESEMCLDLQNEINAQVDSITLAFELTSQVDCLQSLAATASLTGYCQPSVDEMDCVHIAQGHHPILTHSVGVQQSISNDIHIASGNQCIHMELDNNAMQKTLIITGPNASGKSVYLKQCALTVYLAHIGSWVPAKKATIGLVDRLMVLGRSYESIVDRTSALGSDLAIVADMIRVSTAHTLVLLDEFGRGTSPTDGLGLLCGALASLTRRENGRPAVLAITHFKEINAVASIKDIWHKAQLKSTLVKQNAKGVAYLYRIVDMSESNIESSRSSHALECARNAGIPQRVLLRIKDILHS